MIHNLPQLPYEKNGLEPYISLETLEYHYSKHHKTYVDNLNNLIIWTEFENMSLEDIIKKSTSWPIFNNAAQVWNHSFYFLWLKSPHPIPLPEVEGIPRKIMNLINRDFWSFENFKIKFNDSALKNFWSGWTWLVIGNDWKLEIINTSNAQTILTMENKKAILTCDVWEHAYYIDVRNARAKYLENFWNVVDWELVNKNI